MPTTASLPAHTLTFHGASFRGLLPSPHLSRIWSDRRRVCLLAAALKHPKEAAPCSRSHVEPHIVFETQPDTTNACPCCCSMLSAVPALDMPVPDKVLAAAVDLPALLPLRAIHLSRTAGLNKDLPSRCLPRSGPGLLVTRWMWCCPWRTGSRSCQRTGQTSRGSRCAGGGYQWAGAGKMHVCWQPAAAQHCSDMQAGTQARVRSRCFHHTHSSACRCQASTA